MRNIIPFTIFFVCAGSIVASSSPTTPSVVCAKPKATICHIKNLPIPPKGSSIVLPDLSGRSTLKITEGQLANLTQTMASAMGTRLRTVQLEGLSMERVFILPTLENVHLRNNRLSTIETTPEVSVRLLDLRNNRLKNVTQLAPFVQLEELYLDDNFITELKMDLFAKMENLRVLSVSRNNLTKVASSISNELVLNNLEILSLAFNELPTIRMGNWQLPLLKSLLLNNNKLVQLQNLESFERFPSLERLALAGNSWSCAWLDQALLNVTVTTVDTSKSAVELIVDAASQKTCTVEQVNGICCEFTVPDTPAEELFLPEIETVRQSAKLVDKRHKEFLLYGTEQVEQFAKHVHEQLEQLNALFQRNEPHKVTAKEMQKLREDVKDLETKASQLASAMDMILAAETEQKRLLHFMLEMKNNLVRQAIETDGVLAMVDQEQADFDRQLEQYLAKEASTN